MSESSLVRRIRANFPRELQARPNWVTWRRETRNGKATKVPINPITGGGAKSNDPSTWTPFDVAAAAMQRQGADGLGFMFSEGVFGIDIDHCVNTETGEIAGLGTQLVEAVASYAEFSPSGTGLHIISAGAIPTPGGKGRKFGGFEAYGNGRFFTVTGSPFAGAPAPLRNGSEEIRPFIEAADRARAGRGKAAPPASGTKGTPQAGPQAGLVAKQAGQLSDEAIMVQARAASNGAAFARLWGGDVAGYVSQSEADLALCNHLAFWACDDAAQMDRLFRASGLYRAEKWNATRGSETYGAMTIRKALESPHEVYRPRRAAAHQANAYRATFGGNGEDADTEGQASTWAHENGEAWQRIKAAYAPLVRQGYEVRAGRTWVVAGISQRTGAKEYKPLAHFAALIVEDVETDKGGGIVERAYTLEGVSAGGKQLKPISVPTTSFAGMGWVSAWGNDAIVCAGQTTKDKLREAIQCASLGNPSRTVYAHTGWIRHGEGWAFLHAGGAVGAPGLSVLLPDGLRGYQLPEQVENACSAAAASMEFLDVMDRRLSIPLLAQVYLAPLFEPFERAGHPVRFPLYLSGRTQSGKTTVAKLALGHFGGKLVSGAAPGNFQSTWGALEQTAFLLKDVMFLVDDYKPLASKVERQKQDTVAQNLIRAWADGAGRTRLDSSVRVRPSMPPRGAGLCTGESLPAVEESGIGRLSIVEIEPGFIPIGTEGERLASFTALQAAASDGLLAQAMLGYIEWLRPQMETLPDLLAERFTFWRGLARNFLQGCPPREAEIIAWQMVALEKATEYWGSVGVCTDAEGAQLRSEALCLLAEGGNAKARDLHEQNPVQAFLKAMRELEAAGRIVYRDIRHLPKEGEDWPGYVEDGFIGYRDDFYRYVLPGLAYKAVNDHLPGGFMLSEGELGKRLRDAEVIVPGAGSRPCGQKKIRGQNVTCWFMRNAAYALREAEAKGED